MSRAITSSRVTALGVALMLLISACSGDNASKTPDPATSTALSTTTTTAEPPTTSATEPPTTTTTTSSPPWTIPTGPGTQVRGLDISGNYGLNRRNGISDPPEEWFEWMRDMNANWVGISLALYVPDLADPTVTRRDSFTDQELIDFISQVRERGFEVYMTLAFENVYDDIGLAAHNPRWAFGDPTAMWMSDVYPEWDPAEWRWDPKHPEHEAYVAEFFATYTQQAVHFAELAEAQGVGMLALGAETGRLFNVSPDRAEYRDELVAMVAAVREVYTGLLTYKEVSYLQDIGYGREWPPGRDELWEALDLDVIGMSWWYPLVTENPTEVLDVAVLEQGWREIFDTRLVPMAERHPDLPIIILELGYSNTIAAPFKPNIDLWELFVFEDADRDGVNDGNLTQANSFQAFFNVESEYPGVVDGVLVWDAHVGTAEQFAEQTMARILLTMRSEPAGSVVREAFNDWRDRD